MKVNLTELQIKSKTKYKSKDSHDGSIKDLFFDKQMETRLNLLDYLNKTNKNYLKSYRKRNVKNRKNGHSHSK